MRIDGQRKEVNNYPFLHVGRCITVDVIKSFLDANGIKYYIGDSTGVVEEINGVESHATEIDSRLSGCDSIEQTVDAAMQQAETMRQSILKDAFEGRL